MIDLKNVNKYFFRHKKNEIHVINDTSLSIGDTGLVALLGPSGSGKTTLLNAIGGLDKINSGEIYINGEKMPKIGSLRKDKVRVLNIGYIFQDYNLLDTLSVFDNVAISLKMIGIKNKTEIKQRVDYILELVGMYRYRNKLAGNLSGGQRQRVGIARAIVKNPQIIIADEPTGNLDSKNTIEIMNIIKTISQDKLVILVTHEKDLAHFYASRIINLVDGKVVDDFDNEHENELDYKIDNKIYLKDFKNIDNMKKNANEVTIYKDKEEKVELDIVVKNGNIYIKSRTGEKIEVVNEDNGIEFIDDHYTTIKKDDFGSKKYDFSKLDNSRQRIKYSSIYNFLTMIKTGFKKVANYTFMKKVLLLGFFFSAMFIIYSLSTIFGAITIKDENFLDAHKEYIAIENTENNIEDYIKIKNMKGVRFVIPGDSKTTLTLINPKIWQLVDLRYPLSGSIAGSKLINRDELLYGELPNAKNEIVIDKRIIDIAKHADATIEWLDVHDYEDYIGLEGLIGDLSYKIVGISDSGNPCLYFEESELLHILSIDTNNDYIYDQVGSMGSGKVQNYDFVKDKISLKEGRLPLNDYEVIINYDNKYNTSLGDLLDYKVNNHKLKVVGFYTTNLDFNEYVVSSSTWEYATVLSKTNLLLIADQKDEMIEYLKESGFNAIDNYDVLKKRYIKTVKDNIIESLILSGILLFISFVEIFLMIRASFLSRIKEVGIYRAIGVKKTDIYKMFLGEILVITTIAGLPGAVLMSSILREVTKIPMLGSSYIINVGVIGVGICLIYILNIFIGLLPIRSTIKKTPAEILSRTDVD